MFCPSCGIEISDNQRFCRSCGMGMQSIAQAVAEHQQPIDTVRQSPHSPENRKRELGRRGTVVMLCGGAVLMLLVIGFLLALGLHQAFGVDIRFFDLIAPWAVALGLILIVTGLGIGIYPQLIKKTDQTYGTGSRDTRKIAEAESAAGFLPPTEFEPVPSVIEHTTRTLEPLAKKERITAETK